MSRRDQVLNNYHNEASIHSKSYFRDMQGTNNALPSINPSSIYMNHHHPFSLANPTNFIATQSDTSICDGMNNCHLTDSWANYMDDHNNSPLTRISSSMPILNSYLPALELQVSSSSYHLHQQHQFHHHELQQQHSYYLQYKNYLESLYNSLNHYKYVKMTENSTPEAHPQQFLMRDGFSRRDELDYEQTKAENSYLDDKAPDDANNATINAIEPDFHQKIKTCIKYQDRNKKLDFKVNFRDENRKVNGCFYDSESISPGSRDYTMNVSLAPPKKKWLKTHYLTSQAGIMSFVFVSLLGIFFFSEIPAQVFESNY